MGHPTVDLERRAMVGPVYCHHLSPSPVSPKDPENPGAHAISIQDVDTSVPIQGTIRLIEVQEYLM